jgi:hypothetical protein
VKYINGTIYEGEGEVDLSTSRFVRNGKGKLTDPSIQYEYDGYWRRNVREGRATVKFNGSVFEGTYRNDLKESGKMTKGNIRYEGRWNARQEFSGTVINEITKE